MRESTATSTSTATGPRPSTFPRPRPGPGTAAQIARYALVLGVLADVLLRGVSWGINMTIWVLVGCLITLSLGRRQGAFTTRHQAWPLLLVGAGAAGVAWRDSGLLLVVYEGIMILGAALTLMQAQTGSALRGSAWTLVESCAAFVRGMVQGWRDVIPPLWRTRRVRPDRRQRLGTLARGLLLGLPLLVVFGGLFASADPLFARYLGKAFSWGSEDLLLHAFFISVFAWISGGALTRLWLAHEGVAWPERAPLPSPGAHEVLVALGLVNLIFLAFIAVQAGTLFGGRSYVEATLGLSYAEYARGGFFQLVTAAALVLPTLLLSEWVLRSESARLRRGYRVLGWSLILLVGVVLVSAIARMRLYQAEFGLTELRLFTQAFLGWLAFLFVWFGRTALLGRHQRFLAGAVVSGVAMAVTLSVVNPDAVIIRANAWRATAPVQRGSPPQSSTVMTGTFDPYHAARVSGDGVPALLELVPRLPREHACVIAHELLTRWSGRRADGWRSWNWGRWRARRHVEGRKDELAALMTC